MRTATRIDFGTAPCGEMVRRKCAVTGHWYDFLIPEPGKPYSLPCGEYYFRSGAPVGYVEGSEILIAPRYTIRPMEQFAMCDTLTGEIFLSPKAATFLDFAVFYLLFHEQGHILNPNDTEQQCDEYALSIMSDAGFSPSHIVAASSCTIRNQKERTLSCLKQAQTL